MATEITVKRGIGKPAANALSDDGGELALDHQTLTLYSKSTVGGAVGVLGLLTGWRWTAPTKWTADIDVNGHKITNGDPVNDGDALPLRVTLTSLRTGSASAPRASPVR